MASRKRKTKRTEAKRAWDGNDLRERKVVSFSLPESARLLIDTMATFDGVTKSDVVERAVMAYFANRPRG